MLKSSPFLLMMALCVSLSACQGGPATPSPEGPPGHDGEWSGTTSQGRPIAFTVSADQKVTAITIGYNFGGCSGTQAGPSFGFGSGSPEAGNYTQILATFSSNTAVTGSMIFGGFSGCTGLGVGFWSASKR